MAAQTVLKTLPANWLLHQRVDASKLHLAERWQKERQRFAATCQKGAQRLGQLLFDLSLPQCLVTLAFHKKLPSGLWLQCQ